MNIRIIFSSRKIKIISIIILFLFAMILFFSYRVGEVGITPLRDYCSGYEVNKNIIHKILPDAKFKIGHFVYDVDKLKLDKEIKALMDSFKNSNFPHTEEYWTIPYCIGHQFWLE